VTPRSWIPFTTIHVEPIRTVLIGGEPTAFEIPPSNVVAPT